MTVAFLAALAASVSLRLWLSARQVRHVRAHRETVPPAFEHRVPPDAHRRAADYTVARVRLGRVGLALRTALLLLWTLGGGLDLLAARLDGAWLLLAALGLTELCLLPLSIYSTFVVEQRFGFNRTTPAVFVTDLLKSAALGVALGWPLLTAALALIGHGGPFWWAWLWAGWMAFSLLLVWIYPTLIAPLFNRFTPLPDGEVKKRVEALLERVGFSSDGLFVMDGSRRSAHANAYFTGWGSRKRIVLFDTLCAMLEPAEIEAVLAHEVGHAKKRHVWSRIAVSGLTSLAGLLVLAVVIGKPWFFAGLGVSEMSYATGLLLFLWVAPLFSFPATPLWSAWSRKHEYEADSYAAEHADAEALVRALVRMYERNAATLTPDPLYSAYYDSHPPAALRVARLEAAG